LEDSGNIPLGSFANNALATQISFGNVRRSKRNDVVIEFPNQEYRLKMMKVCTMYDKIPIRWRFETNQLNEEEANSCTFVLRGKDCSKAEAVLDNLAQAISNKTRDIIQCHIHKNSVKNFDPVIFCRSATCDGTVRALKFSRFSLNNMSFVFPFITKPSKPQDYKNIPIINTTVQTRKKEVIAAIATQTNKSNDAVIQLSGRVDKIETDVANIKVQNNNIMNTLGDHGSILADIRKSLIPKQPSVNPLQDLSGVVTQAKESERSLKRFRSDEVAGSTCAPNNI
jgi:hypothetical protein